MYAGKTDRDLIIEIHTKVGAIESGQKKQNGMLLEHEKFISEHKECHVNLPSLITIRVLKTLGAILGALSIIVGIVYSIISIVT